MVKCTKCGTVLDCGCKGPESKESALEKKPGAIWVHVTDDAGVDLAGIGVERGFPAPTNGKGLAIQDPLKPDTYPVTLAALSSDNTDKYDLPSDPDYEVRVENGAISHVDYTLLRKATLAAEFVLRSDDQKRFEGSTISVTVERLAQWSASATPSPLARKTVPSDKGLADVGPVSAGKYKLTPDYSALDKREQFDVEGDPHTVDLSPSEPKSVKFHVQQKAALKVEIVFKRPKGSTLPKRYLEDFAVPVNIEFETGTKDSRNTNKGIADFAWVLPGKYRIRPDYSVLDACKYDWPPDDSQDVELKSGDNDPVVFEVEPLYQKVQFVAHCIFAIPDLVYQDTPADATFLDINTPQNGPKTFAYKNKIVDHGLAKKPDLEACIQGKATLRSQYRKEPGKAFGVTTWFADPVIPNTLDDVRLATAAVCDIANDGAVTFKRKTAQQPYTWENLTGTWKSRYHGKPVDKEDVEARVAFVKDVLQKAHAQAVDDPKVLKVLLFPECFFQGLYGAYPLDETGYLVSELQKAVAGEDWRDWVFGFGTVNTLYAAYQPTPREVTERYAVTEQSSAQDMNNHAIVIRGGLGNSEDAARMIQKLVNSAELADDLIPDPGALRPQAVNATVQFGDTTNDQVWIKVLNEILRQEGADGSPGLWFGTQGLPAEWWKAPACAHGLFEELGVVLRDWGMARLIRAIRVCAIPDVADWNKWAFVSLVSTKIDTSKVSNAIVFPELRDAVLAVLKKEWERQEAAATNQGFDNGNWTSNDLRRAAVLAALEASAAAVASECGFKLSYQQTAIAGEIVRLKQDDTAAKAYVPAKLAAVSFPSILPVWKKLLVLYAAKKGQSTEMKIDKFSMSINDYVFAAPRKAAPWYKALDDARTEGSCKRLIFGLEICADHGAQRIKSINTGASTIGIDIQMIPSAGMKPFYIASRVNGFALNCDGWSTKVDETEEGGKNLEIVADGPSPFNYINEEGFLKYVSPSYPHSAVCKRTLDTDDDAKKSTWLKPISTARPDADLAKVIFGKGPGELHFYEPQDLPR